MGIPRQQRPVVVAAELAVGVVEQQRRLQPFEQALDALDRQGVAGRIVRRAEEERPARIALDLGLQLVDGDLQIGPRRQEARARRRP